MNNLENGRINYGAEGLNKSVINKRQILIIEQSLTEAWKNHLIIWSHCSSQRPVNTRTINCVTYFFILEFCIQSM